MKINWFPGHMKTSLDMLSSEIRQCDIIIYVLDARCPYSCINPEFENLIKNKPMIFVLNKYDLTAPSTLSDFIKTSKHYVCAIDSQKSGSSAGIIRAIENALREKIEAAALKGIQKTVRAVVVGVPNCGKSTLINNLAGKSKTLTADKPGVTRVKQWVPAKNPDWLWLLDTPGVLWPNLENQKVASNLAYVGSIKDDIMDTVELAKQLLVDIKFETTFDEFCKKRGYILKGGKQDEERCAKAILIEFRSGKFGRFNLDKSV